MQEFTMIEPAEVSSTWNTSDVDTWLEDNDIDIVLSEAEKRKALGIMQENFDANYGYNWHTLGNAVEKVISELRISQTCKMSGS